MAIVRQCSDQFSLFLLPQSLFRQIQRRLVFMPGGFGTLDELFEVLTLVQTTRIPRFPLILFGSEYWSGLLQWLKTTTEGNAMISPGDLDLLHVTDSTEEVVSIVTEYAQGWATGTDSKDAGLSRRYKFETRHLVSYIETNVSSYSTR